MTDNKIPMRVLIVDDDYVSRTKLKVLLSQYGDCDAVPTGSLALQMVVHAHQECFPYTLITMDIDMPGMNGLSVVKKIRQWERENGVFSGKEARILTVTVLNDMKTVMTSMKKGSEYFLVKPVTQENLQSSLEKMGLI